MLGVVNYKKNKQKKPKLFWRLKPKVKCFFYKSNDNKKYF